MILRGTIIDLAKLIDRNIYQPRIQRSDIDKIYLFKIRKIVDNSTINKDGNNDGNNDDSDKKNDNNHKNDSD